MCTLVDKLESKGDKKGLWEIVKNDLRKLAGIDNMAWDL